MNELTLDGKIYVSSKRAAEITGYAKDYVGQLCREGRVEARLVGRNWYVLKSALESHRFNSTPEPVTTYKQEEAEEKQPISGAWDLPTYKIEDLEDLPAVHKLAEPVIEEEVEEQAEAASTMEAMQDAWSAWFTRVEDKGEPAGGVIEEEIALEATEAPESGVQVDIGIPPIAVSTYAEALNLRRIREYRSAEEQEGEEEESIPVQINVRRDTRVPRQYYAVLNAVFIFIAIVSVAVGYIGSGFLSIDISSHRPASMLAGVAVYNSAR